MNLDFSSLELAVASLSRALRRHTANPQDEEVRDAVIQRFEYTYELCWKMLKRHLEQVMPATTDLDPFSYPELIREAHERGILKDPDPWLRFRALRNTTSHTYNQQKAIDVANKALEFEKEAIALLEKLQSR